jgi:hypothetical protein
MTENDDGFTRIPPQDLEAEQAVLGGMLLSRDVIPDVVEILDPSEFYRPAHETIYNAIIGLILRGEPADPITLAAELTKRGGLARVGGASYLFSLVNAVPTASNAEWYAGIVHEKAAQRRALEALDRAGNRVRTQDGSLDDVLAAVRDDLARVTESSRPSALETGWEFTDLSPVLDGSFKPVVPTVGARDDGVGMFYAGHVNGIQGESEAGKSWVALVSCLVEINRGNHAVYVDFEDSEGGVVGRLLMLGAVPDDLRQRFHYVRPNLTPGRGDIEAFVRRVDAVKPSIVVVDGVTEAMSMLGLELKENSEIAKFRRIFLRPLADTGAAVVPLDHVVKSSENRGRYALGGVHKLNGVDGVQYMLEAVSPFGINTEGRSRLRIAKDRPAQIRKHALPGGKNPMHWFADLVIRSEGDDFAQAHLYPPIQRTDDVAEMTAEEQRDAKEEAELTDREDKVVAALKRAEAKLSMSAIEALVPGRASVTRRAATRLVATGRLVTEAGPRNAVLYDVPPLEGAAS